MLATAPAFGGHSLCRGLAGRRGPGVCAQADPCSIENAVEHASVVNGDEVIVAPGTYNLGTGTVTIDNDIDLHGPAGGPKPKITTASTTASTGAVTILQFPGANATVSDLELENTGASGAAGIHSAAAGVVAERLVVTSTQDAPACQLIQGTLRDSVCRNTGNGSAIGMAIGSTMVTFTLNLRNVTAVAQGTSSISDGIDIFASGPASFNYVVDAKNTIALGGTGFASDVRAQQSGGATATINFQNSNYDTVATGTGSVTPAGTGTGNQTAPPVFVNQATGNYHQAPNSPTIDAGASPALLGAFDFEGGARTVDSNCDGTATPDIGADELTPCPAPNNNFANAQILNGNAATVAGTNTTATEEPGEDNYATEDVASTDPTVTHSVWYRWTSPGNGPATVDLCAANDYDTMLAVFTGGVLGSLTLIGANNNSVDCPLGSFASKVSFTASQGTTYQILVDGCCGLPHGNFSLDLVGPPIPALAPPSHNFGPRAISAGPTAAQTFTLSNTGGSNLTISSVALGGAGAAEFAKADADCTGSGAGQANNLLTPGDSCTVGVTFDPSTTGPKSATLDVATNGGNVASNLSGSGGAPVAALAPSSQDFGSRAISAGPSTAQTLTVSNTGSSDLTISSIVVGGADSEQFAKADGDCTGSGAGQANNLLTPGDTCTVGVTFDPSTTGAKSATLDVATNGGNVASNLSGSGSQDPADTTAPETTITKGPKAKTKKKRVSFEFSSSEAGSSFECRLDARQFQACLSPFQVRAKKGKHTLEVRAIDTAANVDATPAAWTWKVKRKSGGSGSGRGLGRPLRPACLGQRLGGAAGALGGVALGRLGALELAGGLLGALGGGPALARLGAPCARSPARAAPRSCRARARPRARRSARTAGRAAPRRGPRAPRARGRRSGAARSATSAGSRSAPSARLADRLRVLGCAGGRRGRRPAAASRRSRAARRARPGCRAPAGGRCRPERRSRSRWPRARSAAAWRRSAGRAARRRIPGAAPPARRSASRRGARGRSGRRSRPAAPRDPASSPAGPSARIAPVRRTAGGAGSTGATARDSLTTISCPARRLVRPPAPRPPAPRPAHRRPRPARRADRRAPRPAPRRRSAPAPGSPPPARSRRLVGEAATPGRSAAPIPAAKRSSASMVTSRSRRSPSASASAFTSRSAALNALAGKQGSNTSSAARRRRVATRMSWTRSMSEVSSTPSACSASSLARSSTTLAATLANASSSPSPGIGRAFAMRRSSIAAAA